MSARPVGRLVGGSRCLVIGLFGLLILFARPGLAAPPVDVYWVAIDPAAEVFDPPRPFSPIPAGESVEAWPAWQIGAYKTVSYRVLATIDVLVIGTFWSGSLAVGGGLALLNAVLSSLLYYGHELVWSTFGPDPQDVPLGVAVAKTVSYRFVSYANVMLTGYAITGDFLLSQALAMGNTVIDGAIYFVHELAWSSFGPPVQAVSAQTGMAR